MSIETIKAENERNVESLKLKNSYIAMLEKALDKACDMLDERLCTCPYDCFDLYGTQWEADRCESNCNDEYAKCWKEYLLKESEKQ